MSNCPHDRALVSRAREGDRRAFAVLVERHYPVLLSSCRRALRDAELARDAAQQAVLVAMLGLGRLREPDRFGAWLIGIGLNVCRSLIAPGRRTVASFDLMIDRSDPGGPAAAEPDPQWQLESAEVARRVRAAIDELPAGQRQAVTLFYLGGLTHAEIADELGTVPGAIKTRLHKARRSLREPLEPLWKEYFAMPTPSPDLIPVRIADLRRTTAAETSLAAPHRLPPGDRRRPADADLDRPCRSDRPRGRARERRASASRRLPLRRRTAQGERRRARGSEDRQADRQHVLRASGPDRRHRGGRPTERRADARSADGLPNLCRRRRPRPSPTRAGPN